MAEKGDDVITAASYQVEPVVDKEGVRVVLGKQRKSMIMTIPAGMRLLITDGQEVNPGDQLTEGSKNPHRILEVLGQDAVTHYLLREMQEVYRPQGQEYS